MSADTRLRYAYGTGGLAHHRLDDALALLADAGYHGVALTLDGRHLDPSADDALARAERLRGRLDALCLEVVVQACSPCRRSPRAEPGPTLVSAEPPGRARALAHLRRACDLADVLRAEAVTLATGAPSDDVEREQAWRWAVDGLRALVDSHGRAPYALAVQPGPGMLVADVGDWARLHAQVPGAALALDTGDGAARGRRSPQDAVRELVPHLGTVAVPGVRREHQPPAEVDVDLPAVLQALVDVTWDGLVTLELSHDSTPAHEVVPGAMATLLAAGG